MCARFLSCEECIHDVVPSSSVAQGGVVAWPRVDWGCVSFTSPKVIMQRTAELEDNNALSWQMIF